jgi:hypothetical protein
MLAIAPLRIAYSGHGKILHWLILSEFLVSAVTERRILAVLAKAHDRALFFFNLEAYRGKPRALVRAIAKRLIFGLSTTAPGVGARVELDNLRLSIENFWLCHGIPLYWLDNNDTFLLYIARQGGATHV